jgi:hypothetical protein
MSRTTSVQQVEIQQLNDAQFNITDKPTGLLASASRYFQTRRRAIDFSYLAESPKLL